MSRRDNSNNNRPFWDRCIPTDSGCWEFKGANRGQGYREIKVNSKRYLAHRYAFLLTFNTLPEVVMHTCDNPPCCNPFHLKAGNRDLNNKDRVNKGRSACVKGVNNPCSKLDEDKVREIRKIGSSTSRRELSLKYGVSKTVIYNVVTYRSWKHV